MQQLASILDELAAAGGVPTGYEAGIILVNLRDPDAHIFVGGADPRLFKAAIEQLIDNPDQAGIVNNGGVVLEL